MPLRLTAQEFKRLKGGGVGFLRGKANRGRRWEIELAAQMTEMKIACVRELVFAPDRKFRFDFAILDRMIAIEIDGAVHRIKQRFESDQEKCVLALMLGWRVLHVTPKQVRNGKAIELILQLIAHVDAHTRATGI
jgi:very-short-patch-repair endonuclease